METKNNQSVTLFVKVAAKPESTEITKAALLADVQGARTESGNYKMELYRAEGEPDNFYLFERWESKAALKAHFAQPYTQGAFGLQNGHLTAPIEMNYLADLLPLDTNSVKQQHRPLTTLIVPFEVYPGRGAELAALFNNFVPLVRQEPGNVEFHFHSVEGDENKYVLYERWETQAHLDAHNALQTTAELVANVQKLVTAPVINFVLFAKDIS